MTRADGLLAVLLFLGAATWGSLHYTRDLRSGGHPFFYQSYFEPAVMTACGKGFLVAPPGQRPATLAAFLFERTDRFSCADLPPQLQVGTDGLYQRPWRYLLTTVGLAWMMLGISWSGLGPLFGMLYGATTTLVYALCRFVAGRVASLLAAAALCMSSLQLANLPNLRDYAKAPFTLALIAMLVALVVRPWRRRDLLLMSLAYGFVLGLGYGFRGDLLIDIPPFLVVVALFLPGGVRRHLGSKLTAIALAATGFLVVGWPILTAVAAMGGCQVHVFLLGLTTPFNDALGVAGGAYQWGSLYNDQYLWATVSNYATRFRPDLGYIDYCSRQYDVASWEYARHILATFPADIVTRAYASVLQILNLPFHRFAGLRYAGPLLAAAFVLGTARSSLRLALFASFVIVYFGGHPAIQFLPRHYFPFEFMPWVILAVLGERGIHLALRYASGRFSGTPHPSTWPVRRMLVLATAGAVVFALPLAWLRSYQNVQAIALLRSYLTAPSVEWPLTPTTPGQLRIPVEPEAPRPSALEATADLGREHARFVEVVLDVARCRPSTTLTFRYDPRYPEVDFSHTVALPAVHEGAAPARLFEPAYATFIGLDMSDPSPACLPHLQLVKNLEHVPLLLSAQLTPGWDVQTQYQRIAY